MGKVETAARRWHKARAKVDEERERLIAAVIEANDAGRSEYDLATDAQVTRMTIRTWLGKRENR